jgi:hypothetical protein
MDNKWVFIISSQRSGSTLLKALLATRDDVSDLPEVGFNKIHTVDCHQPIKVIKRPAGFIDFGYPALPDILSKKIILIRNPYDTVISMQEMTKLLNPETDLLLLDEAVLLSYWVVIYRNIFEKIGFNDSANTIIVKYEDLINKTIDTTAEIFAFVGSHDTKGIDCYSIPNTHYWKWGNDDGGEFIKTLKVQRKSRPRNNERLLQLINGSGDVRRIMHVYGYDNLDI